jgi:putative SOS response-associated peptidase YedK
VILEEKNFDPWLDRDNKNTGELKDLLVPYPAEKMKAYPVSKLVNSNRNDVPECLTPIETETSLFSSK